MFPAISSHISSRSSVPENAGTRPKARKTCPSGSWHFYALNLKRESIARRGRLPMAAQSPRWRSSRPRILMPRSKSPNRIRLWLQQGSSSKCIQRFCLRWMRFESSTDPITKESPARSRASLFGVNFLPRANSYSAETPHCSASSPAGLPAIPSLRPATADAAPCAAPRCGQDRPWE